ncbi:uncharacterized protein LOC121373935 [Gigantopelta aegis]|uniref:uncharacterized protein LOC121373935 n=1 Tax=Gigantopelta aegis TaxID=1735272 RepID=UPI001B88A700|nr:uncharacterized protein LOC121373935 [Gigantopelta aegis]
MDEPSNNLTAFESAFEEWLSKAAPPSLERMDEVETGSVCSQADKNNNTDSDVDGDLPSARPMRDSPPLLSSHFKDVQNSSKTIRLKRLTRHKPPSMALCQAIKRKYFSNHGNSRRHFSLQQFASNNTRSTFIKVPTNSGASRKKEEKYIKTNFIDAKCPTSSHSDASRCRGKYGSRRTDDGSQLKKNSVEKFTDSHSMSVPHSTEVSPVSDAGYGEDIAVDSEHDDISRRSNGYHSMEEFQLTSVSPPSQSESPLSSAGEGNHPAFLCSKSLGVGFNLHSVYRTKSARKNHSPNSYDSDFVESPNSCHIPPSKSPSHTVSHCNPSKSPEHLTVLQISKHYKLESQRDEERPLILKIKCDRSPQYKKSPMYFCENVTPTDSPPKLKLIDSERNSRGFASENNSCRKRSSRSHSEISNSSHEPEQRHSFKQSVSVESVTDRLCECDSVSKELAAASPDHSCDDVVLEEEAKIPRQNRQKSRRNGSRVCGCCMSSPKKHRFRGEKRKRSLSVSNTPGSIVFTSGSTSHLKCDVTYMSPKQRKFVKSALNLSSLQQKLHILFIHLFPRLESALVAMPPESLRFEDMLDEVIRTLEASPEDEQLMDSEELSKQLLGVSLRADTSSVTVFEPQVQLCNTPKDCLEEYQEKIYTLLKLLLPDLTLKYEYVLRFPKDLEKFLDRLVAWNYRSL